jgi:hypothetical protein
VKLFAPAENRQPSWQINLGSLGIAAAQFARCGFDVSIQYGADKPAHDMVVTKGSSLLKVVVKGSEEGFWNLTQSYVQRAARMSGKNAAFHGAIEMWLDHHGARTVCCLVQFQNVPVEQLPRIYLATPSEVAQRLRETADGRGDSILYEGNEWASGLGGTTATEGLPASWRFSLARIQELMTNQAQAANLLSLPSNAEPSRIWPSSVRFPPGDGSNLAKRA